MTSSTDTSAAAGENFETLIVEAAKASVLSDWNRERWDEASKQSEKLLNAVFRQAREHGIDLNNYSERFEGYRTQARAELDAQPLPPPAAARDGQTGEQP